VASTPTPGWFWPTLPSVGNSGGPFTGAARQPHRSALHQSRPSQFPAESYPGAVGFFFGNTELSLELWTVISGFSGFDD
jgi:hypothetical protein